jgi:hypothetical protein
MAWSFRKGLNLGPLRINLSKGGIGFSIGARGFRAGRDARGRGYTQISVPGTGIYNRQYLPTSNTKQPQPGISQQPVQAQPSLSGRLAQMSPSTKYLAVLMAVGGIVWLAMRLFAH